MVLEGLVVLEIGNDYAASFCGLQLADAGAEVIKVESNSGDKFRKIGPFNRGVSQVFMSLNRGKKSVSIDFQSQEGKEKLIKLIKRSDVIITDWTDESLKKIGIDYESVKKINNNLIYAQIYGYGKVGPYKDLKASELSAQAFSGIWRYVGDMTTPEAQRALTEPYRIGVYVANGWAANFTFIGILAALYARQTKGISQKVETSLLGSIIAVMNQVWASLTNPDSWEGFELIGPMAMRDVGIKTRDGYVREPHVGAKHEKLMEFYNSEGIDKNDSRMKPTFGRGYPMVIEDRPRLKLLESVYGKYSTSEILKIMNEDLGSPCMSMNDYSDAVSHPQTKVLNIIVNAEHPMGGFFQTIGAPWHLSETPIRTAISKPPLLGEHNDILFSDEGHLKEQYERGDKNQGKFADQSEEYFLGVSENNQGPLKGIKVVDFSGFAVGPWAGSLLGMLGAEVIKVDPPFGDGILEREPTQNGVPIPYIAFNQGKSKCVSLNLKDEQDHKIALKLIEEADILIENFRTGVMERLGLGYEEVSKLNPKLIYCSSNAYGTIGPLAKWGAVDDLIQGYTGYAARNGGPNEPGEALRFYSTNDLTTSMSLAAMALLGLLARNKIGRGQLARTTMIESVMYLQTGRYAEFFATGKNPERLGSAIANIVPDQAFKTRDGYIAVSATTDDEWHNLCIAMNLEELSRSEEYKTNELRVKNRERLIEILSERFKKFPSIWWFKQLSKYGVPCGLYKSPEEVLSDRNSFENKFIVEVNIPIAGKVYLAGPPFRFSKTPAWIVTPVLGVIPKGYKNLDKDKFPDGFPGQNTKELREAFKNGIPLFDTDKNRSSDFHVSHV